MAARQTTARLQRLDRMNYDTRYRFDMEPHAQIEKMLLEWASYRLYGMTIEYDAVIEGKKRYTIDSEGMWILSHLFSNWQEMDMPPPQYRAYQCDNCRLNTYSSDSLHQCPECKKMLCSRCAAQHVHIKWEESDRCDSCGQSGKITQCTFCKKRFCDICSMQHIIDTMHSATHGQPKQDTFTGRRCYRCDEREMKQDAFHQCMHCGLLFCRLCYINHFPSNNDPGPDSTAYEELRNYFYRYGSYARGGTQQQQSSTSSTTQTRSIPVAVQQALNALGVSVVNANEKAINTAYRKKAKSIHPDIGGKEQEMVKLNLARDTALKWAKDNSSV